LPKSNKAKEERRATVREERARIHRSVISVFRGARQDADLTQEAAADLLGWSRDVLVNFENDRRDFGVADLILFANRTKMDPAILFARILAHVRGR
jgi:DNA-binding XRE family transcriptional regulator